MLKDQLQLGHESVSAARSAIANLIDMVAPHQAGITNHPFVSRLIKGMANVNPPAKRYHQIWSPQLVLSCLRAMPPNEELSLLELSKKTVMLAALVTGSQCQSLHNILLTNMEESEDCFCCRLPLVLKTSKASQREQVLHFPKYQDQKLCVFTAIKHYKTRTELLRPSATDKLFIISQSPYNAEAGGTISRWIKELMEAAGIDMAVYTSHSMRKAATSQASDSSVSCGLSSIP